MLTLTNRIDMRPGAVPLVIHLGQYDSDFSLVFELYSSAGNFTVESGTTAMIRGTKTDGHAYDADATIDISAKTVTVAGSEQMTAAKGRNVYELVLTKSGKVLSTANFILDVERAAMDADTIASESVLKELNAIIAGSETATEAATNAASAADRAEDAAESVSSASAQIATNTADIADLKADLSELAEKAFSIEAKNALIACFQNIEFVSTNGEALVNALIQALNISKRNPNLPSEYDQVEFLEATGTQYIETELLSRIPFRVEAKAKIKGATQPTIVGAGVSNVPASRFFLIANPYDASKNRIGNRFANDTATWEEDGNTYTSGWLNIRSFAQDVTAIYDIVSGIEYSAQSGKVRTYVECNGFNVECTRNAPETGYPIFFFYQSNASTPVSGAIYACVIYSGSQKIFEGVPCIRKSDNVAGLFDVIGDIFYTNAGTGVFVTGDIVN